MRLNWFTRLEAKRKWMRLETHFIVFFLSNFTQSNASKGTEIAKNQVPITQHPSSNWHGIKDHEISNIQCKKGSDFLIKNCIQTDTMELGIVFHEELATHCKDNREETDPALSKSHG